jgi:nitrogen fixation NifU-like protein
MDDATRVQDASNPSCGDSLTLFLKTGPVSTTPPSETSILDASFTGDGCAISAAGASLLTEHVRGMPLHGAAAIREEDMYALFGVEISIARRKCALLAWRALREALAPARASAHADEQANEHYHVVS